MTEIFNRIHRIPRRRLYQLAKSISNRCPDRDSVPNAHFLALFVIGHFLGIDWVRKYVEHSKGFLREPDELCMVALLHGMRVIKIADMLFNLQDKIGFASCVKQLRGGQIESGFAELEVGEWLASLGVKFRFVIPVKSRRSDYDLDILFPNGTWGCADTKCKIETTAFSKNTVINSLNTARKQLPRERPGAIFIKLPPLWLDNPTTKLFFTEAVEEFLRGTKTVVCVEGYRTQMWFDGNLKAPVEKVSGEEFINADHKFEKHKHWNMVTLDGPKRMDITKPIGWISLIGLFDKRAV